MKRSKETEKKIIRAALALFVHNGYHGTSINAITQKVGVTKGALYFHFKSKGELLLRIIDEFNTRYLDPMIQKVTEYPDDAFAKLHHVITFSAKFAVRNLDFCVFLLFLTTELNADVDFKPALKKVYRKYQNFISELIAQGIRQGLIKKEIDPDLAALTFMAIHDGVLHQWVLNRDRISGKRYVKTFRTILMEGLKA